MKQKDYQFIQIPAKLILALDSNCEKVLISILTLLNKDGNNIITTNGKLLSTRTGLSTKVVYNAIIGLSESNVITVRTSKYYDQEERNFKSKASVITINEDKFKEYDQYTFEEVMLRDDLKIKTKKYFKSKQTKEEDSWNELYDMKEEHINQEDVEQEPVLICEENVEPMEEPKEEPIEEPKIEYRIVSQPKADDPKMRERMNKLLENYDTLYGKPEPKKEVTAQPVHKVEYRSVEKVENTNSYETMSNAFLYETMKEQLDKTGTIEDDITNELTRRDKLYTANPGMNTDNFYKVFGFLLNLIR